MSRKVIIPVAITLDLTFLSSDLPIELCKIVQAYHHWRLPNETVRKYHLVEPYDMDSYPIGTHQTSGITNIAYLFCNTSLDACDVSDVTAMKCMFNDVAAFDQTLGHKVD